MVEKLGSEINSALGQGKEWLQTAIQKSGEAFGAVFLAAMLWANKSHNISPKISYDQV